MNFKQLSKGERDIYREAKEVLNQGTTVATWTQRFFASSGALSRLATTTEARKRLVRSPLYCWLKEQLEELRYREAKAFEREVNSLSGRITITVPKSLHAALKREAHREGVSLSELIRLKLGISYGTVARLIAGGDTPASSV